MKRELETAIEDIKQEHEVTRQHFDSFLHTMATTRNQQAEFQKRQEIFLDSLRFDGINSRQNDVSESSPKTFDWIFHDEIGRSWDSFKTWLEHGEDIYWVNGKAGSGKSTLMKFIISDQRTIQSLKTWSKDKACIILKFYFWLSGHKLQRSLKGLFCSLTWQLLTSESTILGKACEHDKRLPERRTVNDWSLAELQALLLSSIESLAEQSHVCLFLDGIDEFDQDEDVQDVLDLTESLSRHKHVKICVSSRPEVYLDKQMSRYSKLRLQDLTADDLKIHARDALQKALDARGLRSLKEADVSKIISEIAWKADGVFLWVHFSLKSLLKGMRNEDDVHELLGRLEDLPSGMEQLYYEMWKRLNGDE